MWPWEHLAFGYLTYSVFRRLWTGRAPRSDARRRPLALRHSSRTSWTNRSRGPCRCFRADTRWPTRSSPRCRCRRSRSSWLIERSEPISASRSRWATSRTSRGTSSTPSPVGKTPSFDFLLWPLVPVPTDQSSLGFLSRFHEYFGEYVTHLGDPAIRGYIALELGLLLGCSASGCLTGCRACRDKSSVTRR